MSVLQRLPSEPSPAILLSTSATLPFFDAPRRSVGTMPEQVFIAVTTGKVPEVVGFAEVSRRTYAEGCETSPVGFLEGWYVVAARRRQGIGRALVASGEAWAQPHTGPWDSTRW